MSIVRTQAVAPMRDLRYDRPFFGHPRGLSTLFCTEMWERFSYYGMRALLILFMTAPVAGAGIVMLLASRPITRLMGEVN